MQDAEPSVLASQKPTESLSKKEQVCILALKVFDWCVKPLTETDCFTIPAECDPPVPPDLPVECRIVGLTASIVAQTPGPENIHTVTARVDKEKEITILESVEPRVVRCTFTVTATSFHTTTLFAPPGTTKQVEVSGECGPCRISADGRTVCCEEAICLQFESKAPIKLCVPAELCTPRVCTQAQPPCPPTPPDQRVPLCGPPYPANAPSHA
ncbi:MAG: hypothetical protein IMX02_13235 [Limnochordaceae bacterium]|nr:hypothetical protein [Limnochordaceae bacterium]